MGGVPVIIGAGLAGLSVALSYAPHSVVVLGRKPSADLTSSALAQGGIAAAVGRDDSVEHHTQDTIDAGVGLCDEHVVRSIIGEGPRAIEQLLSWGVTFDLDDKGDLACGLEGAHSRRRVVHAGGDSTGAMIMAALVQKVLATSSITFIEDAEATEIKTNDGKVSGIVFSRFGRHQEIETDQVVLATGSACSLWQKSTVPTQSWGHGLALAAHAGAALRDLEFVQFHPTALDVGGRPMPLISEALRGEGARLVTESGRQFVDELAPRDIVARAIYAEKQKGHLVFLDARDLVGFKERFLTISEVCVRASLDPSKDLLPISPVAHYHMGGVATDVLGKTNVAGLYACGEGACTGLHGANRLASNSLLEAVVMGMRVAGQLEYSHNLFALKAVEALGHIDLIEEQEVNSILSDHVGLLRNYDGLAEATNKLAQRVDLSAHAFVGHMIAQMALARTESRGGHFRLDYPEADPRQAKSNIIMTSQSNLIMSEFDNMPDVARMSR